MPSLFLCCYWADMWLLTLIFFLHPFYVCYYEICSLISLRRKGISTLSLINYDIYLYVRKNQVNHELFLENRYCRYIWVFLILKPVALKLILSLDYFFFHWYMSDLIKNAWILHSFTSHCYVHTIHCMWNLG